MAECIVEVCRIGSVDPHPNAERLELGQIKGWQTVLPKGRYQAGDLVAYIPIDSLVPLEWSERWGVTQYLSNGRVRCARLRGEPSFGLVVDSDPSWEEGRDVREHFGITKYIPPYRPSAGDAEAPPPLFVPYTDIENLRHFPDLLDEGEAVGITEKLHGTNCRLGCIEGELMAGSMGLRRKRPEEFTQSTYWFPFSLPGVPLLLTALGESHRQVILYGEVFGKGIQSLHYGQEYAPGFRAFDLLLDGKYLGWDEFDRLCREFGVPTVPLLYSGAYSLDTVRALAEGATTLGGTHLREGVVVKPLRERVHPKVGRLVLKYISSEYLLAKGISDSDDF